MQQNRWIRSWVGYEHIKIQIQEIARKVAATDLAVRSKYRSSIATGLICAAMRDPSAIVDPIVLKAAHSQRLLQDLQYKCVWEYGLEFDLVRNVWAPILGNSV